MIPTLLVGDYLFVSKFSYGFSRFSFPFGIPIFEGRVFASEPQLGDVVVFKLPSDNRTDYIKRVVGLPGDRIQIINGVLNINDVPVKREQAGDFVMTDGVRGVRTARRFVEVLPNGRTHSIIEVSDRGPFDNTQEYTVPKGHYFLLGDNRDSSRDSRFMEEVGYVPLENLVGRAVIIFFSVDGPIWRVWEWHRSLRLGRFFQSIQ
jgi:signal peptidase I